MTTSAVLSHTRQFTVPVLSGPRYSLSISTEAHHREAAQRLRRRVFDTEPGFTLPTDGSDLDVDPFDEFCDHLLAHEIRTGELVGCYRMLPPRAAFEAGGYYTATEFDLSALDPSGLRAVEMGRACVDAAHRSGSVLTLMWAGILRYLQLTGHDRVIGCVSVPMQLTPGDAAGVNVRGVRDVVLGRHGIEPERRVRPLNPVVVDGRCLDEVDEPARVVIPPLMRGYLRLGAQICGEPAHDPEFGVADFVAMLSLHDANVRYLERLRGAAESNEA
ncbi:GNAT family N-acetyltransferase [Rhodococcus artemisiae]|uniref:GNAT family N-acyltransferase n=1 Tax=Rhodococcus artemisiae TaxID=714159 RepID=A0ABU7L7Z5_9NOCA|nr:GNAT family N-acyltransferase [Rhodococcus artemisiae]MEE2057666.1 GNAT family N-acyltransferase [Rhodococcus artemisiae]